MRHTSRVAMAYDEALARLLAMKGRTLTLGGGALDVFLDFEAEVFERRRGDWAALEELGVSGKLAGNAARLAAILCAWADETSISAGRMRDAVALARWFAEHMQRTVGEQAGVGKLAQGMLALLTSRGEGCVLERTITETLRKRKGFDKDALDAALAELEAGGYIQRDEVRGAGRPTRYLYLHPDLTRKEVDMII